MLCSIVFHVKGRETLSHRKQALYCLKLLVWSRAFTYKTYVHPCVTGVI